MSSETFALRFKEAREKKNITIKALQPLVGASPSAMNGYATGKTLPPLDVAAKIARELGVSLDWLCGIEIQETGTPINCADVAILLEAIQDAFISASIEPRTSDHPEYGLDGELVGYNTKYFTDVTIVSETLCRYFQQIKSMENYANSLPEETKEGFVPFMETMRDSLLATARAASFRDTGMKPRVFVPCNADELPF